LILMAVFFGSAGDVTVRCTVWCQDARLGPIWWRKMAGAMAQFERRGGNTS